MKTKRFVPAFAFAAAGALALSSCGTDQNTSQGGTNPALQNIQVECGEQTVSAEGSSAQKNAMDIVARDYSAKCEGEQLNYTSSGSGKGISAFIGGQVDFGGSDSPLTPEESQQAAQRCNGNQPLNIPMVFGPVAVTYNVPGVQDLTLNADVIAKIYQGEITNWNDPAIKQLNPNAQLPDLEIKPFFRSDESGTSQNFQKYLKTATGGAWQATDKQFRPGPGVGQGRDGSDQVTQAVKSTKGALTYSEWSYPKNLGLDIAKIDSGAGPVELTPETVGKAIDEAELEGQGKDLRVNLESLYGNSDPGVYPLTLTTYEIVCSKGYDPQTAKAVKAALTVGANSDPQQLRDAGYVALPEQFKKKVMDSINSINA
ncbi:phosphate ABC transporter substrate-binding protein PstS [Salinifilum ghardaiensis]